MTRLLLVLSLVLAGSLGAAERARAAVIPDPISNDSCGGPFEAESMGNPGAGPFSDTPADVCVKLCKKAASHCKSFAKRTNSCLLAVEQSRNGTMQETCKVFSKDLKGCLSNQRSVDSAMRQSLKSQLALATDECDDWGTTCLGTCP